MPKISFSFKLYSKCQLEAVIVSNKFMKIKSLSIKVALINGYGNPYGGYDLSCILNLLLILSISIYYSSLLLNSFALK